MIVNRGFGNWSDYNLLYWYVLPFRIPITTGSGPQYQTITYGLIGEMERDMKIRQLEQEVARLKEQLDSLRKY